MDKVKKNILITMIIIVIIIIILIAILMLQQKEDKNAVDTNIHGIRPKLSEIKLWTDTRLYVYRSSERRLLRQTAEP